MKRLLIGFVLLLAVFFVLSPKLLAASEQIDTFNSNIIISKDNVATITETIEYSFGDNERHGIKRFVPIMTKASGSSKNYYYNFKFLEATVDAHNVNTKVSSEGNYKVIRLGDPDQTITGIHSYTISYQVWPVVERDVDGDFLNWNITGNYWEVPIMSISATITLPLGTTVLEKRCYSGAVGSVDQDCLIGGGSNQLNVTVDKALEPGEGITVNALLSGTAFSNYLAPGSPPPQQWLPVFGFVVGLLAVLLGLLGRLASWLLYKHRRGKELIIPQYESPDKLSPGEVGLLNDNRSDMVEITATLVDLAVRGYLRIEQTKPKSIFKRAEYKFYAAKSYSSGVNSYERQLLEMLFSGGSKKSVELKSIKATTAAPVIEKVKKALKANLKHKGYYEVEAKKGFWQSLRKLLIWFVVISVLVINIYSWLRGASFGLGVASSSVMLVGLLIGWAISQRTELSQSGYRQWAEVQGLKLFLSVTEKERLKFHDAPEKNPKLFNHLLPFAIALGVEKAWAKQFEDMDVMPESSWYSSRYPFTPIVLADSMSHDLARGVSSSFTPTQSSGGYSGGGFSGGGGGGGGGGSW